MPFNLGGPELIIILVIVLIVFGAGKLPNVMKDVGRGVKEFKRAQSDEDVENAMPTSTSTTSVPASTTGPVTSASAAPTNGTTNAAAHGTAAPARPTETSSRA
jgi:sec-independent protein translocase protein TatA